MSLLSGATNPVVAKSVALHTHYSVRLQPDGYLHLQEGPIDLLIGVEGDAAAVEQAYQQMNCAFSGVLAELVGELALLRQPLQCNLEFGRDLSTGANPFKGAVACAMWQGCKHIQRAAHTRRFHTLLQPLTPMAGVAGAVADAVLAAGKSVSGISKIWVNNGGDIAIHLQGIATFACGIVGMQNLQATTFAGIDFTCGESGQRQIRINARHGVNGVATSGRHGRSLSLGIADSVTVLARDAVSADIAATLIANAVDLPQHPSIQRKIATELDIDSDLGNVEVVVGVAELSDDECLMALDAGVKIAFQLQQSGYIKAALLMLGEHSLAVGDTGRRACSISSG